MSGNTVLFCLLFSVSRQPCFSFLLPFNTSAPWPNQAPLLISRHCCVHDLDYRSSSPLRTTTPLSRMSTVLCNVRKLCTVRKLLAKGWNCETPITARLVVLLTNAWNVAAVCRGNVINYRVSGVGRPPATWLLFTNTETDDATPLVLFGGWVRASTGLLWKGFFSHLILSRSPFIFCWVTESQCCCTR